MIDSHINSHSLSTEIVGANRIIPHTPPELIIKLVADHFHIEQQYLLVTAKPSKNIPRQIAMYICHKQSGLSLKEIANYFGNIKYKGISKAISRVDNDTTQSHIANSIINQLRQK